MTATSELQQESEDTLDAEIGQLNVIKIVTWVFVQYEAVQFWFLAAMMY